VEGIRKVTFTCNPYIVTCPECGAAKYFRCREAGENRPMFQPHGARLKASHNYWRGDRTRFRRFQAPPEPVYGLGITLKEFLYALQTS
jgi:hypothetical protein